VAGDNRWCVGGGVCYRVQSAAITEHIFSITLCNEKNGQNKTIHGRILNCFFRDDDVVVVAFSIAGVVYEAAVQKESGRFMVKLLNDDKLVVIQKDGLQIAPAQLLSRQQPVQQKAAALSPLLQTKKLSSDICLTSPLAGRVVRILVSVGSKVQKGQLLMVIESMKMENELRARSATIVKTLFISQGDVVKPNQELIVFEKEGEGYAAAKDEYGETEV